MSEARGANTYQHPHLQLLKDVLSSNIRPSRNIFPAFIVNHHRGLNFSLEEGKE